MIIFFFISLSKMAMNAKILGCGNQTVVLAHGYGGSQAVWDNIVPNLAQKYQILVFDWIFSGAVDDPNIVFDESKYSSFYGFADELISLIERMNLKGVIFIGHSMAGMIGCIASVKRPELFSHLVLVGASPRYLNTKDYEGGFERMVLNTMFSNIESNFHAWADGFVPLIIGPNDPISIEKYGKDFKRMKPEVALSVAQTVFLSDLRDVLEHVEVPCTIVQGTNDVAVPLLVGYYIQRKIKGKTTLEIVEMEGHCPQLTLPEKLIHIIDRALTPSHVIHG